jgi:hypothetical protein
VEKLGKAPPALVDAVAVARRQVTAAPRLIPIYGHRYLPALPATAGNPVLSVYQTDVIYYASDLRAYIAREFGSDGNDISDTAAPRSVPFWSDLIAALARRLANHRPAGDAEPSTISRM